MELIAFYLPQYHPIPENDKWWGKGFTEWTNVAKAKPLFKGHLQPKIPADLGFYDLRLPETRKAQADLAKEAGITAFCYWHYWFGNKKKLLNFPFEEVVRLKEPDFPFCLAWANHSWYNKSWSVKDGHFFMERQDLLIEQTYPGVSDYEDHFYDLLQAFKDPRYLKIRGKLLFVIYSPVKFTDFPNFKTVWNKLAQKEGIPDFFFVAHMMKDIEDINSFLENGYDAVNLSLHHKPFLEWKKSIISRFRKCLRKYLAIKPQIVNYSDAIELMDSPLFEDPKVFPTIVPNWDHTPRSGNFGRLFYECTPELFRKHIKMIFNRLKNKDAEDQVVFIKSWNEWGEGNYMEPDLTYGRAHIDVLRKCIDDINPHSF